MRAYNFFHGLAAYKGGNKPMDIIRKSDGINGVDACFSDKPIGKIGVYCYGDVKDAYYCDAWSWVENGDRLVEADHVGVDMNYKGGWLEALKLCIKRQGKKYKYSEVIMQSHCINAVWVKRDAKEIYKKTARVIARKNKVPVVFVDDNTNALSWQ